MNPKYLVKDEVGEVVLTRNDIAKVTTTSDMTEEEYEKAISDYLTEHNATRIYSSDSLNDYQEFTKTTAIYPKNKALEYLCLGLASEAGEVAGKLKKVIRDHKGFTDHEADQALLKEVGDVLWYCARIVDELGGDFAQVAQDNMDKLSDRKNRGKIGGSGDNR